MTFRTLIFGYVPKGEAYDESSYGFTFQSMSADSTHADMALAEQSLLFQQLSKLSAGDELTSFSFSTGQEGRFGVGLGTAKGASYDGRNGNHVSHAIITDDPDDFGTLRPAQLFGSPIWRTELAASREIDPLQAPLPFDPRFDLENLRDFVATSPDGVHRLQKLLSALVPQHEEEQVRVLIGASSAEIVARWIGAATVLLPAEAALTITFQVFADEISGVRSRVVAVNPKSAFPFDTVVGYPGFAGFDLDSGRASDVPVSDYASFWVPAFFEHDPYDVQEAIELSDRIGGMRLAAARTTALAIVLGDATDSQAGADAALEVLSVIDQDGFEEIGQELVDRLSAANKLGFISSATLVTQLDSLVRLGIATEADYLRTAIVDAFAKEADPRRLLSLLQGARTGLWQSSGMRAAASGSLAEIIAAAREEQVFDLLVAGSVLDLDEEVPGFTAAVPRFAALLVERQDLHPTADTWLTKRATLVEATRVVEGRLARLDAAALAALDRGAWQFAESIAKGDPHTYPWLTLVGERKRLPGASPDERTAASRRYIAAGATTSRAILWGLADPRPADALEWLVAFPELATDREAARWACSALEHRVGGQLGRTEVDLLVAMYPGRDYLPAYWAEFVVAARSADEILAELADPRFSAPAADGRGAELGSRFHPALVVGRSPELARQVVGIGFAGFPAGFVRGINYPIFLGLVLLELTALFQVRPVDSAVMAIEIARASNLDRDGERTLYETIRRWQSKKFAALMTAADSALHASPEWAALCDAAARGGGLRGRFTDLLPRGKEKGR